MRGLSVRYIFKILESDFPLKTFRSVLKADSR